MYKCIEKIFMLSLFCVCAVIAKNEPYTIPNPRIEAFQPRGFRVSIPDQSGVRLFAFHAAVNRKLNGLEAGDISKDIIEKTNGRWVFEDKTLKLNIGDKINFWLFVIRGNLGYRLDDQSFTVNRLKDAPTEFINEGNRRPTTTIQPQAAAYPSMQSQFIPPLSSNCPCSNQHPVPLQPITIIPPICIQPLQPAITEPPPSTTTSLPVITPSADLQIWRELLVNLSTENGQYRDKVLILQENNRLLKEKLDKIGDINLNKLLLTGRISKEGSPIAQVELMFREKLKILDTSILKSAVRNDDGSITFEMNTLDDKLLVLRKVNEKLQNSQIIIEDINVRTIEPRLNKMS